MPNHCKQRMLCDPSMPAQRAGRNGKLRGEFPSGEIAVVAANQKEGVGCELAGDEKGEGRS
jgi:hypothetical protein